jgi:hypothetical protein
MTFAPRRVELPIAYQGDTFVAVFSWATIARFEEASGGSILDFAQRMATPGQSPRISDLGQLLLAALSEKHPELTLEHAMELVITPEGRAALGEGLAAAMPQAGDDGEAGNTPPANPRRPGAAKGSAGRKR